MAYGLSQPSRSRTLRDGWFCFFQTPGLFSKTDSIQPNFVMTIAIPTPHQLRINSALTPRWVTLGGVKVGSCNRLAIGLS
jgi:hypothetical protein